MNAAAAHRLLPLAALLMALALPHPATAAAAKRETFAIDYIVTIAAKNAKIASVRWELSGAEEAESFVLRAPKDRFSHFSASGKLAVDGDEVTWKPNGPYGHIEYRVQLDHLRGTQQRYDSYAGSDWIVARSRDLFPRTAFNFGDPPPEAQPRSRTRLIFHLPAGWKSAAPHPAIADGEYALRDSGKALDRPRGWLALGKIDMLRQEIDGVMVQIARAPGSKFRADEALAWIADAIPRLHKILGTVPEEVLIVSAGDPMWHGGLSAYRSFFMHGDRPLRTPDKTSPVLHELFHVMQPFRPARDGDWIAEGLAEYYSLELQRRAGVLPPGAFQKGLEFFARFGLWNVDLTRQHDNAGTNNSAPLVMYALDQRIQRETAGRKRLDDVVAALAAKTKVIDTKRFRQAVKEISGKPFAAFFNRHVIRGEQPRWQHKPASS